MPSDRENWIPIAEMAQIMGLTVPKFRALHERLGRPRQRQEGTSRTARVFIDSVGWLQRWNDKPDKPDEVAAHHARYKKTMADRAEFDLAIARSEMLTLDQYEKVVRDFCRKLRNAHELQCTDCKIIIREAFEDVGEHWREAYRSGGETGVRGTIDSELQAGHTMVSAPREAAVGSRRVDR